MASFLVVSISPGNLPIIYTNEKINSATYTDPMAGDVKRTTINK